MANKLEDPESAGAPTGSEDAEKLATAFDGSENKGPSAAAQEISNVAHIEEAKPRETRRGNGDDPAANGAAKKKKRDSGPRKPQAEKLIALASEAKLFHTPDGTSYADIFIDGHRETWKVRSTGFSRWLKRRYHDAEAEGGAPNNEAMATALGMIEAHAHYNAPEREVHVRIGGIDGKVFLDLCDAGWHAVEIDETGWRIVDAPPVRFRRAAGMKPVPDPLPGGSIDALKRFLNARSQDDFILAVSWVLAALRPRGPYPVLALAGEHGSAKSTFSAILRSLVDPNTAPLRALPREDRDLFIAATNSHVIAFDNISGLPSWISDTLCRLATGAGFAVRQLYTDQDEVLFDAARPIVLNGIEDIVIRPDLADRALLLTLEPIQKGKRLTEADLHTAFAQQRPFILGALLSAVSNGLKRLPDTKLEELPRMADFAIWAAACGVDLWGEGIFQAAYDRNIAGATESIIEADTIAAAVRTFMADRELWTGSASELLVDLSGQVDERVLRDKAWPGTPRGLSGRLRRAAPMLRAIGISIIFGDRTLAARLITISRENTVTTVMTVISERKPNIFNDNGHDGGHDGRPDGHGTDRHADMAAHDGRHDGHDGRKNHTVMSNHLENKGNDGHDGHDANIPTLSADDSDGG